MPILVGLKTRKSTCKICSSFPDDVLNKITLDLLTGSRTWEQIMQVYNPFLPPTVKPLNTINLNSHKKHSDFSRITRDDMKRYGFLATTEAEALLQLYQEQHKEKISYSAVLQETTRARIHNLSRLQEMFNERVRQWQVAIAMEKKDQVKALEVEIRSLQKQIDETLADMARTVAGHIRTEKGLSDTQVTINVVNVVQNGVQSALTELMGILMLEEFTRDPELARRIHMRVARVLDKHVSPVLVQLVPKQDSDKL